MPRFSVITVTLNNLVGLQATARSLQQQTCRDFEWIVIDGGSTDGTVEFLKTTSLPIHYWCSETDNGIYDAMNKGINKAAGDYLWFLNAGDCAAAHDMLERLIPYLQTSPAMVYGHAYEQLNDGTTRLKPARHHRCWFYGLWTHHQAILYRRENMQHYNQTEYPVGADYSLSLQIIKSYPNACIPCPIIICIFEAANNSAQFAAEGRHEQYCARRDIMGMPALFNALIVRIHRLTLYLRRTCPALYHAVRFARTKSSICL